MPLLRPPRACASSGWHSKEPHWLQPAPANGDPWTGRSQTRAARPAPFPHLATGARLDVLGIVAQGLPQDEDVVGQAALLDERIGPAHPE